jgi:hypothetical protein
MEPHPNHATTNGTRAGRREWWGLAVLALPMLLVSMDLTVLHLAVPSLSADLMPSSSQLLWIVDVTPEAAEAARDTLGGAAGVAEQLPPGLLGTAGNAFTDGLQVAAAVSAVALAGVAVVAAIVLRRVGPGSDVAAGSDPSTTSAGG